MGRGSGWRVGGEDCSLVRMCSEFATPAQRRGFVLFFSFSFLRRAGASASATRRRWRMLLPRGLRCSRPGVSLCLSLCAACARPSPPPFFFLSFFRLRDLAVIKFDGANAARPINYKAGGVWSKRARRRQLTHFAWSINHFFQFA